MVRMNKGQVQPKKRKKTVTSDVEKGGKEGRDSCENTQKTLGGGTAQKSLGGKRILLLFLDHPRY